jgi:hypothetical protein
VPGNDAPEAAAAPLRDVSDDELADEIIEFVRANPGADYLDMAEGLRVPLRQAARVADT